MNILFSFRGTEGIAKIYDVQNVLSNNCCRVGWLRSCVIC